MYNYKATLDKVIDGDTVDLIIDLGFDIKIKQRVRLLGIDTPELRGKTELEKQAALISKEKVEDLLEGKEIFVSSKKEGADKYNRYLAEIFIDDMNINKYLLDNGYAKVYNGEAKSEWSNEELNLITKIGE